MERLQPAQQRRVELLAPSKVGGPPVAFTRRQRVLEDVAPVLCLETRPVGGGAARGVDPDASGEAATRAQQRYVKGARGVHGEAGRASVEQADGPVGCPPGATRAPNPAVSSQGCSTTTCSRSTSSANAVTAAAVEAASRPARTSTGRSRAWRRSVGGPHLSQRPSGVETWASRGRRAGGPVRPESPARHYATRRLSARFLRPTDADAEIGQVGVAGEGTVTVSARFGARSRHTLTYQGHEQCAAFRDCPPPPWVPPLRRLPMASPSSVWRGPCHGHARRGSSRRRTILGPARPWSRVLRRRRRY